MEFRAGRNHLRVQMATGAGIDLHGTAAGGLNALRVELGFLIAFDHCNRLILTEIVERALEQRGLARTGRADEVQRKNTALFEPQAIGLRRPVVLGHHRLLE